MGDTGPMLALTLHLLAGPHGLLPQESGGASWLPAEGPEELESWVLAPT